MTRREAAMIVAIKYYQKFPEVVCWEVNNYQLVNEIFRDKS